MKRTIQAALFVFFAAVFLVAAFKMVSILNEYKKGADTYENLSDSVVSNNSSGGLISVPTSPSSDDPLIPEETPEMPKAPITVDFDSLLKINSQVVGWLYCEGTEINLPVAQSDDNAYYLHRLIDGTYNSSGTLFLDYRVKADFSDPNSIIYGHNMKNKTMFGNLDSYKNQAYYDEHPILYLLTPQQNYMVELLSGFETDPYSATYTYEFGEDYSYSQHLESALEMSLFKSSFEVSSDDRILTLSTCSDNYSDVRFVLVGRLVPIQ